ncbi:ferric reductase NAD binding domain-containing protein [Melampsora americana]|nr:ferric reductase NAD binding domain-containing protein [Melampsora americana]
MGFIEEFKRQFTARRLLFYLIWHGVHAGLFVQGWYSQKSNEKLAILNLLTYSVWISRGAGLCLVFDGALIFLPVCRRTISFLRPKLTWLMPLDENVWFHRQVAYSMIFYSMVHTTAHYRNMYLVEATQVRPNTAVGIMYTEPGPLTGHIMLIIMVLMATTAHWRIRRQCFEAFWYTHQLAFFWAIAFYSHASGCFVRGALPGAEVRCMGYNGLYYEIFGGALYFLERLWREIAARRRTKITSVLLHPSGTVELRFQKPSFKYVPGQWLFLQVPEVSRFQWHPFTISSAPDEPYISLHMRQAGDFTRAVGQRLGATPKLAQQLDSMVKPGVKGQDARTTGFVDISTVRNIRLPTIRIDGPHGAPAEDVFKFQFAVLIGAGIGVTPFSSILKNIYFKYQRGELHRLRKVHFIWLNKEPASFGWFRDVLRGLEESIQEPDFLQMDMYLTGHLDTDTVMNVTLNSAKSQYDALTGLEAGTHFGRPDWKRDVFEPAKNTVNSYSEIECQNKSRKVGVFFCGPSDLGRELKNHCKESKTSNCSFEFYKEHCQYFNFSHLIWFGHKKQKVDVI